MLQISENPGGLVVAVPMWIGIATVLLGLALVVCSWLAATPKGRGLMERVPFLARLPLTPLSILTAIIATVGGSFLVHAGVRFLTESTTLEPRGVIVKGILGEEDRVAWSQVRRQEVEQLARGRGRSDYLLLYTSNGDYLPIGISGLAAEDSLRLQRFVAERIKR